MRRHLERTGTKTLYIAPGAPAGERLCGIVLSRLRDELLNVEEFANLAHKTWYRKWGHVTEAAAICAGLANCRKFFELFLEFTAGGPAYFD